VRCTNAAIATAPLKSDGKPSSANGTRISTPVVAVAADLTLDAVMPAVFVSSNATSRLLGFAPPASVPRPELSVPLPR
jgi:hypothetical protein